MTSYSSLHDLVSSPIFSSFFSSPVCANLIAAENVLKCAFGCAEEGGKMIRVALARRGERGSAPHDTKISDADLVTETDVAVETMVRGRIARVFPDHLFVGEEGTGEPLNGCDRNGKFVWIVDPIDGTTNFVNTFPVVAVSIGFAYGDETIFGVVHNPMTDELWFAWKGCGAWMKKSNGEVVKIHTSGCDTISSALVSTGFAIPFFRRKTANVEAQKKLRSIIEQNTWTLMSSCRDIRRIGSAACDICYVAMGRTDTFYEFGIKEWDVAAALVILHEAGGDSSTVGGVKPYSIRGRNILAAASQKLRIAMNQALVDKDVVKIIEAIEQ